MLSKDRQRKYAFEKLLSRYMLITALTLLVLLGIIFYLVSANFLFVITALLCVMVPFFLLSYFVIDAIKTPLLGLSASLEAIRNEDYSLRVKPKFNDGAIKSLSDEVNFLANDLRLRKLNYDQHAVLVLNLIEQLETPIAVFDQHGRLKQANDAFSQWCGAPWLQLKYSPASNLGLEFKPLVINNETSDNHEHQGKWCIQNSQLAKQWQIRFSQISMQDEQFQLLVLTNIEQLVHQTEQLAWHKMTRVLSHEINNSLAPIKSLSQSLSTLFQQQNLDEGALQALNVITSRSDHLMQFVNRYASLAQEFEVNIEEVNLVELLDKVTALFTQKFNVNMSINTVMADAILLEQTLINLIKNAIEASKETAEVTLVTRDIGDFTEIQVIDNGAGIANPDNLFVPFYTTKENGKGIGLALCRNMIEQQGGKLSLHNRQDVSGAIALIRLAN